MAGSLNKVTLIGNLGKDPEVRRLNSGDPVVNFSVATTESWKDKRSGERQERTEWHNVVIFNENLAKVAEDYLRKGSKVYVEGKLQTRKWQDQSGADKYTTEVVLQNFGGTLILLDKFENGSSNSRDRDDGDSDRQTNQNTNRRTVSRQSNSRRNDFGQRSTPRDGFPDDEIPF